MGNELVKQFIVGNIKKEDQRFITYFSRNKRRLKLLLDYFEEGIFNIAQSCEASEIPESTYHEFMKYGKLVYKYIDDNDIDYKDTDYLEFISTYLMLKKYFNDGTHKKLKGLQKLGKDRIITTNEGKETVIKGDVKAATASLNHSRKLDVGEDEEKKSTGINVVFNFPEGLSLKDMTLKSQRHLSKIEEQNILDSRLNKQ